MFTGDLSAITRDQGQDLVKRYAGRVVSGPSKKTSYVVVGANPGPVKMKKIEELGLATLDEDAFLDMIRRSKGPADGGALAVDVAPAPAGSAAPPPPATPKRAAAPASAKAARGITACRIQPSDLWTVKYAPQTHEDIIGNPGIYEKLSDWLQGWHATASESKAALLSGPPGIGKTTMANVVCKVLGYDSIEMNASDTRSKKTLHETVREIVDTTSLGDFKAFLPQHKASRRHILIMDEVDGMSAGDRGGMAELITLIKKTRIPIICICNDRSSPKVRSLANHCLDLRFRRPDARQIAPRLRAIAEREGLDIQPNALEELCAATHADIRQILNLLSTYQLTQSALSYDASKALSIGSAKDVEHGPFDATSNLLGSQSWSRMSLGTKIDQYFIDSSLVPLMIHENYLKCKATNAREIVPTRNTKPNFMDLAAAAAESLSQSDRVDSLIRGSNQEWSLAPMHAIMSAVLPAYYVQGAMGGRIDFAGWLGQNSRTGKNQRLLTEVTKHVFLHTQAGRSEIRLDYTGAFAAAIITPMLQHGAEGIDQAIRFMDEYSVSRDDIDSILDMVLDQRLNSAAFSKIPTAVRSAFTRKYNQGVHRLPYVLGGGAPTAKKVATDVPNGAGDADEDDVIFEAADDGTDAEEDISKDKMIKAKPVKAAGGAKKGTGKAPAAKKAKK